MASPTGVRLIFVAHTLDCEDHALVKAFPQQLTVITDIPLRAKEIMENALQFELTGDIDERSHTNLATVSANVDGDRIVLGVLRPLIATRDSRLVSTAEVQLTTLANLVNTSAVPLVCGPRSSL